MAVVPVRKDILNWFSVIGILLCGTVLLPNAYDQALTPRHLIWCALVIALVLCTDEIRIGRIHIFAFGYLAFVALSGIFAINKSEWCYALSRTVLAVTYLSVVKIDKKLLTKAMILLGVVFTAYFWWDYSRVGSFNICYGLMRQKNYWSAAHFFVIPFCYNAITKGYWKKLSIVVMLSMLANIALLCTRSVQLAVAVSMCIVYVWHKDMRKWIIYLSLIALEIAVLISGFKVFGIGSLAQRAGQWEATLYMIKDNLFGVGAGNWLIMFPKYAWNFDYPAVFTEVVFRFPHNDYIWIWSEIGVGVVFYIGMMVYAIKKADRFLVIALTGFMLIAFFSALHERPFSKLMLMTFIAMACEMKTYRQPKLVLSALIFVMVVFGFRYRADVWNKKLRANLKPIHVVNNCKGYSPFSTLTHAGFPWKWWEGMANWELKRNREAIPLLKKAWEQNPHNIYALNGIGIAYGLEKNYYEAGIYFDRALDICPTYSEAKKNLVIINKRENNHVNKRY